MMSKWLMGTLILLGAALPCGADDLTDAITGADPRDRYQTGQGVALRSALSPQPEESEAPPLEAELDQIPPAITYDSTLGGLPTKISRPGETVKDEAETEDGDFGQDTRLSLPESESSGIFYDEGAAAY